ncbi:hypothetical protein [Citrobacter sp. Cpo150]|uniref:hypothetical protein n=1 Tax=Citrobacter sp. Cpo150 TaxID=2985154 RepID=UPI002574C63B|nr:hypothetical protein [Citrobacter sp. Cpo150]MDM2765724.1 hypothetical protein [Citrobacter sp. Cpo150]
MQSLEIEVSITDPVKDANHRLKKVVKTYRSLSGLSNYSWKTKEEFRLTKRELMLLTWMASVMALVYLLPSEDAYLNKILMFTLPLLGCVVFYLIIVNTLKTFKGQVWTDDYVSEEDLIYLSENADLKSFLLEAFNKPLAITYTHLDKNRDLILMLIQNRIVSHQNW